MCSGDMRPIDFARQMCSVAACEDNRRLIAGEGSALADHPLKETAEIEITCPRCSYRLMRTVAQLRTKASIDCPECGEAIAPGANRRNEKQG